MIDKFSPIDLDVVSSELAQKAKGKLDSLPLAQVREAGIWRDRSTYFLNIAYPSMQAMNLVTESELNDSSEKSDGKSVALYAHVPFCTAECYYCHYYKQFRKPKEQVDEYVESIEQELTMQEKRFGGLTAALVYIGGGTPSYMTPDQIDKFFSNIENHVEIPEGIEISFEMHPESATDERLEVLRNHQVNRINLGVESFSDITLMSENRRHTAEEASAAYERIKNAGFDNINLDLIYGLKGQTVQMWQESLDEIKRLQPSSTTMYFLRLKRGTPEYNLWKREPSRFPTDNELLLMHAMNFERMEGELGYIQNPVDWFIRDTSYFHTYQDHNWRRSDETELLGIGPSAYSYVNGWQYYNTNDTQKWQSQLESGELPVWKGEYLTDVEPMRRTVMLGIKMGIDRNSFAQTYGIDIVEVFPDILDNLARLQLISVTDGSVELTYLGKLLADEVGQQFYSDTMKKRMSEIDPELISTTWPQFNP